MKVVNQSISFCGLNDLPVTLGSNIPSIEDTAPSSVSVSFARSSTTFINVVDDFSALTRISRILSSLLYPIAISKESTSETSVGRSFSDDDRIVESRELETGPALVGKRSMNLSYIKPMIEAMSNWSSVHSLLVPLIVSTHLLKLFLGSRYSLFPLKTFQIKRVRLFTFCVL